MFLKFKSEKEFIKILKREIESSGVTQVVIAKKTGLTQGSISQLINGIKSPSLKSLIALDKYFSRQKND